MNDRLFLETWEQQIEYKKVHSWGVDFNNEFKKDKIPSAEKLVEDINNQKGV